MRMCNVLVFSLILAGVSLQIEMNGNGDNFSLANTSSARPTVYLNQKITSDAKSSPVLLVLTSVERKDIEESPVAKDAEAPRVQRRFFENILKKKSPITPSNPKKPPRQQAGRSFGKGLGNKPSSGTRASPGKQRLEKTSTKNPRVVRARQVSKIENENKQVNQKVVGNNILATTLMTLSRKAKKSTRSLTVARTISASTKKSTRSPTVARTTSASTKKSTRSPTAAKTTSASTSKTTVAVIKRTTSPKKSIGTTRKTTAQTQKYILKTSLKRTQKEKHKETSTTRLDRNEVPIETTENIAPEVTDLNLKTTKMAKTSAITKPSSRFIYRTKEKRTFASSKSTSEHTFVATVLPSRTIPLSHTLETSARPVLTTIEEEATTDEEMLGIQDLIFRRRSSKDEQRPQQKNKSALYDHTSIVKFISSILQTFYTRCNFWGIGGCCSTGFDFVDYDLASSQAKKNKDTNRGLMEQPQKARKMPRKMESANINATKFSHAGPLVLDAKLKGPVRHALEDKTTGAALSKVQFDPKLNEIVDIGTDIDIIKGASRMTTVATTDTGQAVKKTNQSTRSMIPKTAKISDRLYTDKKKPKNEKVTKTADLPPNPTAAAATKGLKKQSRKSEYSI